MSEKKDILLRMDVGTPVGIVTNKKVEDIIQKQKSGLPKIPIEERMKMAIENPTKYEIAELADMYNEFKMGIKADKYNQKEAERHNKIKAKILIKFEKAIDKEYNTSWKTYFTVFGSKVKHKAQAIKNKFKKE